MSLSKIQDEARPADTETAWAIRIENASKTFKLHYNKALGPLLERLLFWRAKDFYKPFEAVRDFTLRIPKGQVVGLVGRNGSGKTTALKLIAGLLLPDSGTIDIRGKVTALLAIGVGVNPEFNGRENAMYVGMLLGMTKREILEKIEDIIEFSEIGAFIDQPFRTYSTGMKARLLFSISMSIRPEIMIIDEALATGDSYFVAKCNEKIKQLCRSGATIILVSHNLLQIQELADRVLVMDAGKIAFDGPTRDGIAYYHNLYHHKEAEKILARPETPLVALSGKGDAYITDARLTDRDGSRVAAAFTGDFVSLRLTMGTRWAGERPIKLFVGIDRIPETDFIGEIYSERILDPNDLKVREIGLAVSNGATIEIDMFPLVLLTGQYSFWIVVQDMDYSWHAEYRNVLPFQVSRRNAATNRDAAFVQPTALRIVPALAAENETGR